MSSSPGRLGRCVDDVHVARAIAAMKADLTRRWTVAAPLRWLTEHRLEIARGRLLESDHALALIAAEVGYGCEFAFAKAFKRLFGIAPGLYRRLERLRRTPTALPAFRAAA
jgi:AraC-like DNA-binding protein